MKTKYTVQEVYAKMEDIANRIKNHTDFNNLELDQLTDEADEYITNSDMTYAQAYSLTKTITTSQAEFNIRMSKIRNTILNRNK